MATYIIKQRITKQPILKWNPKGTVLLRVTMSCCKYYFHYRNNLYFCWLIGVTEPIFVLLKAARAISEVTF